MTPYQNTADAPGRVVNPMDDPAAADRAISEILAEPAPEPEDRPLKPLPVTSVRLAGGFETGAGEYVYDVEVRELTGEDEEALAKSPTIARALMTILNRATVRIGDTKATPDMLDLMLAGDRELVLLQIRKATFGATEIYHTHCSSCDTDQELKVDLDKDVKVKRLGQPEDRNWEMDLRSGQARVSLPDGVVQRKLALAGDKSVAELNTILLGECLQGIGDMPSMGASTARGLGLADRQALLEEIVQRQPGPQLGEVVKQCESCSADLPVNVNLALLFRL